MSFLKPQEFVKEGDTVVIYVGINSMHFIEATATIENKFGQQVENIFQSSYGALKAKDIIGMPYGSRIQLLKGWVYILQPVPSLWTNIVPHRTQIIYTPDISMIIFQLEIKPGSVVIESGTGSGSLSHFLCRAVSPYGHLHTYDFHQQRVEIARQEFEGHGFGSLVSVYHRDVCASGFGSEVEEKADAVFLDLPSPHQAVAHATKAFKKEGGRFCSFSPCIEQVQSCHTELRKHGFKEIQCFELLQHEHLVKTKSLKIIDLDFVKEKKNNVEDLNKKDEKAFDTNIEIDAYDGNNEKKRLMLKPKTNSNINILTTMSPTSQQGHTSFLTFATFPPAFTRSK